MKITTILILILATITLGCVRNDDADSNIVIVDEPVPEPVLKFTPDEKGVIWMKDINEACVKANTNINVELGFHTSGVVVYRINK